MNKTANNNHKASRHIMRALNLIESQGFGVVSHGGRKQEKKSFGIDMEIGTEFALTKDQGKEEMQLRVTQVHTPANNDEILMNFGFYCRVISHTSKKRDGSIYYNTKFLDQDVFVEEHTRTRTWRVTAEDGIMRINGFKFDRYLDFE